MLTKTAQQSDVTYGKREHNQIEDVVVKTKWNANEENAI